MTDDTPIDKPEFDVRIRFGLLALNPMVYYDPLGKYAPEIIPRGHYIRLRLMVNSFGWDVAELSPDVQRLLLRLRDLLLHQGDSR